MNRPALRAERGIRMFLEDSFRGKRMRGSHTALSGERRALHQRQIQALRGEARLLKRSYKRGFSRGAASARRGLTRRHACASRSASLNSQPADQATNVASKARTTVQGKADGEVGGCCGGKATVSAVPPRPAAASRMKTAHPRCLLMPAIAAAPPSRPASRLGDAMPAVRRVSVAARLSAESLNAA